MIEPLRQPQRTNTPTQIMLVTFDDKLVRCHHPNGTKEEVSWDELSAVEIFTTDAGPFVCDVFFVLHGNARACVVPQEAEGCKELLERLQRLPGFNNQAVIDAMCCTSNARFQAWQKVSASESSGS
jgi:hypothetical protein